MSISVEPKWESAEGDGEQREIRYIVQGTDTDIPARAALLLAAPTTYDGLVRQDKKSRVERINDGMWLGVVPYSARETEPGGFTLSFDTTGGTGHITQSLETVDKSNHTMATDAPDFKGAIGVGDKGDVEGTDIVEPKLGFNFTLKRPAALATSSYVKDMARITGCTNNATWKGFAAGEVLFLGATGNQQGPGEDFDITLQFAASENITGLSIPGLAETLDKKGWEYLWVRYSANESEGATVRQPTSAYVERVYKPGDFSLLGVGT